MTEHLKRCPFCGNTAALKANYSNKTRAYFVFVACTVCHAQAKPFYSESDPEFYDWNLPACDDAVNAWNNRQRGENTR